MPPQFLMVTCQVGAEKAVKGELARRWPTFRAAFCASRFSDLQIA